MKKWIIFNLFYFAIALTIGAFACEYLVEFWMPYLLGTPVDIPFFPCLFGGIFFSTVLIPLAVLTWIISFVI